MSRTTIDRGTSQHGITPCGGSLEMVSVFDSLPRVPPQNCHFEWPLAERRKTGTDALEPLDTCRCPAASSCPGSDLGP